MKTPFEKCSEKEVLWNKVLEGTVVKIHERDLWGTEVVIAKVLGDAAFLKSNSCSSSFE